MARVKDKILFEIDASVLGPVQARLFNTLCHELQQALTTDKEANYFDSSAEALRICAALIKQAHFGQFMADCEVPYSAQALEYSIETLQDYICASKLITYDH